MPAYFFHLAFELYQSPPKSLEQAADGRRPGADLFLPPRSLDLFTGSLPAHSTSSWASYIAPRKGRLHAPLDPPNDTPRRARSNSKSPSKIPRSTSASELKPSRDVGPCHSVQGDHKQASGADNSCPDWRFDEVTIESIDMEEADSGAPASAGSDLKTGPNLAEHGLGIKGKYIPSQPQSTNVGYGVVHLYRDIEPSDDLEIDIKGQDIPRPDAHAVDDAEAIVDKECTTLCILAVPSYMTPSDFLGWVGEETRDNVTHFRLIRTSRSNKYMVLMKFREASVARQWQRNWNGKLFNSMEPENCHAVFIRSIQFQTPDVNRDPSDFPDMSNDPFTPSTKRIDAPPPAILDAPGKVGNPLMSKPVPPPTPSLLELPTCPVCLERMDETSGLATIFCQHVFHCACLQKWRGSGCPVCRYTQEDLIAKSTERDPAKSECQTCGSKSNPWICLICGHVGCGRYDEAHAFAHYERTSHAFAMDISTQHIWDYAGDEYVHRLIQNSSDGKLVELPAASSTVGSEPSGDAPSGKMESMSLEYTHLLTSQLDSQRMYFEEQVERAVDKASKASAAAEQAAERAIKAYSRLEALEAANGEFANDMVPSLERDKVRAERRAEKAEGTARQMQNEWREKSVINDSLMDRISHLEKQLDESQAQVRDLEEQNRDLSFFISGMEKLKGQGEEVQEGTITVGDAPSQGNGKKKKKNKIKRTPSTG